MMGMGEKPGLARLLCRRGHIELWAGWSGRSQLERARVLAEEMGVEPGSGLREAVSRLELAQEAFEAGDGASLVRGERLEDWPESLREGLSPEVER